MRGKRFAAIAVMTAACMISGNGMTGLVTQAEELPAVLNGETFVYDELETGEGSSLYTLMFTETGYRLYKDGGAGILSEGSAAIGEKNALTLTEERGQEGDIEGSYKGNAFQSPSVTLTLDGEERTFEPASDTEEYVYLSWLGVYEGDSENGSSVLILDRWFEFYLYEEDTLTRGTYQIYSDGTASFTTLDGETENAAVQENGFTLENTDFTYTDAAVTYDAEHAMGTYTLSLYDADVFVIRGVDGYVKAMGTIEMTEDGGSVTYFPRSITNEAELDARYTIPFTKEGDSLIFPSYTYLLPRSGNIDEDTGYGSYWSAGTTLEFIQTGTGSGTELTVCEEQDTTGKTAPVREVSAGNGESLEQVMPSVGTARPLVLLIDFPDNKRPRFITAEAMEEALFDVENSDSLSAYYNRSSYGNLTIDGTVLDWYRTEKNRDEYDSDTEIMKEAINYYISNEGLELSDYDADGDGVLDSLYVLWAGNLVANGGMWSAAYRSSWDSSPEEWGTKITGYIFVPGNTVWSSVPPLVCNTNSLTHETGHLLGLNDYYSYDTSDRSDDVQVYTGGALEGGLGGMDMMDANIADHNAFSKWLLGWLTPTVIEYEDIAALAENEAEYTLRPSNEAGDAIFVKLRSSENLFTELLVIEVISPTQNMAELTRLQEPAVRILHVDATRDSAENYGNWRGFGMKYDNSYTSTKFISLVEADGKDTVLNFLPGLSGDKISYDPADLFAAGDVLSPNSYPNTNGYDAYGNATVYNGLTVTVESISEDGEAVIRLGYEDQADTLSVTDITPDPAAVPYDAEGLTTVPAGTEEIALTYDREIQIAGEDAISKILLSSGNELLTGYEVTTDGAALRIQLAEPMEGGTAYTLVVPAGALRSSADETITNNSNLILSFAAE